MTVGKLNKEVSQYKGTGGIATEAKEKGFQAGFRDNETGKIYKSLRENGEPSTIHSLDGLPDDLVLKRHQDGDVLEAKSSLEAGFIKEGKFFTRKEASEYAKPEVPTPVEKVKKPIPSQKVVEKELNIRPFERMVNSWVKAETRKGEGSWDRSTTSNYAKTFITPLTRKLAQGKWNTQQELTVGPYKKTKGTPSKDLRTLIDIGEVQIAWDNQGMPHYAMKGIDRGNLLTEEEIDRLVEKEQKVTPKPQEEDKRVVEAPKVEKKPTLPVETDLKPSERSEKAERNETIEKILKVARKPVPQIKEKYELKGTDGKWRSAFGFPDGVKSTGERRLIGYVFQSSDGTTFGERAKSKQELIDRWNKKEDKTEEEFRADLLNRTDKNLQEAADYWLKKREERTVSKIEQTKPKEETDEQKLERLEKKRFKIANDERMIEVLRRRVKADPSKWKVGDGVGYRVHRQINRGFRIVEVKPDTKEAVVIPVADTGLTIDGSDRIPTDSQVVHIGDLVRDRKYDAKEKTTTPKPREQEETEYSKYEGIKVKVKGMNALQDSKTSLEEIDKDRSLLSKVLECLNS
jgi:hypothetical protein